MTERKPPGIDFESWIDRQIREASERGDFANLKGIGKPLPHLDQPYDELWWIKDKMSREDLSYLPPTLVLRKEAQDALETARQAPTEASLRRILTAVNGRIREAIRAPLEGPPLRLSPFDIDEIAREWRQRHGR